MTKDNKMTDTMEQMKGDCEHIRDTLCAFYEGKVYDNETGRMVEMPDDFDDERYSDLYEWLLCDNLGVKITTDINGREMYGCEICVAWGGPNIYIDTNRRGVFGYWSSERWETPLSGEVCDMIDDCVEEARDR